MRNDRDAPGALRAGHSLTLRSGCAAGVAIALCLVAVRPGHAQEPTVVVPAGDVVRGPIAEARQKLAQGRIDEALAIAGRLDADSAAALTIRAHVAELRGQYDEAMRMLAQVSADDPLGDAALELGLLQRTLGRVEDARRTLTPILAASSEANDVPAVLRAARAARALGAFRAANGLFRAARTIPSEEPSGVDTEWGELFLEKYNLPDARRSFEAALERDPQDARAHLGLARTHLDDNPPAAAKSALRALELNPALAGARVVLATLALDAGQTDTARTQLGQVLETNPNSLDARALLAAIEYVEGRHVAYEEQVRRVLAVNPGYGEVFRVTASRLASAYRFEEAVGLARRAVEIDGENVRARAELGMHLLRTGDETEARTSLDAAFERDPYDVVTFNLLSLLDTLESFDTITDGDLVIRLHPDETPVLRDTVVPLAKDALQTLAARYGVAPRGPILVELFPKHDDFAVRTLGLPGMVGALGACFGRVVTLDSPRARPPGAFNWQATLWHEMAHVVTLQLSNQRVPRWLTEGISVYEERRARPHWGRESDFAFASAFARGEAIPLSALPDSFSNPRTIGQAYHQAGLFVEYLVTSFGEPALRGMLKAYGEGLTDEQVFAQVLKSGMPSLQAGYETFLDARNGRYRAALALSDELAAQLDAGAPDQLASLAAANPGSYLVQMALGRARQETGDTQGAADAYAAAWRLVPLAAGEEGPGAMLPGLLEALGRPDEAKRVLEESLGADPAGVDQARELARVAASTRDVRALEFASVRLVEVVPFEADAHLALGRLALARGDAPGAVRSFERALAAGPADPVAVRTDLAESLLDLGRNADAKREVINALQDAPRYERAQELLLKIVDAPVVTRGRQP